MNYRGITTITGESGAGKTSLMLSCGVNPNQIVFVDDDVKSAAVVDQLAAEGVSFATYLNLATLPPDAGEDVAHEMFLESTGIGKDWNGKAPAGATVCVIDNYARLQSTFKPFLDKNIDRFNRVWSQKGDIRGSQMWIASQEYEKFILGCLKDRYEAVFISVHLKDQNINGVKTGNQVPELKKILLRVSNMTLWLLRGVSDGVPDALVLKRPQKYLFSKKAGLVPVNVLPLKIKHCDWETLNKYWERPVGASPSADEIPSKEELQLISGTISDRDKELILKTIDYQERLNEEKEATALQEAIDSLGDMPKLKKKVALKDLGFNVKLSDL